MRARAPAERAFGAARRRAHRLCQLGITLSSLGLGAVGEPAFHHLLEPVLGEQTEFVGFGLASAAAFSIITVAHVVLGELASKSAAISRTGTIALLLAPPMRAFYLATKPVVDLFDAMGNLVLKPFGIPSASEAGHSPHSEDELRQLLLESRAGGLIQADESQLSEAALVIGDLRARGHATPPRHRLRHRRRHDRPSDRNGDAHRPQPAAAGRARRRSRSRPRRDQRQGPAPRRAREEHRPPRRRPTAAADRRRHRVDEVLRDVRRQRRHVAPVVDEHGTVTGLLTLEDVLEELVGKIDDEFDIDTEQLVHRQDGELRIDGSVPVRLVARELGLTRDAPHETTLNGHLIERLGRVPHTGGEAAAGRRSKPPANRPNLAI